MYWPYPGHLSSAGPSRSRTSRTSRRHGPFPTSTGIADGARQLAGKTALCDRGRPQPASGVGRDETQIRLARRQALAYATAGRPARSRVRPAEPSEAPCRARATTRSLRPEGARASQEPLSAAAAGLTDGPGRRPRARRYEPVPAGRVRSPVKDQRSRACRSGDDDVTAGDIRDPSAAVASRLQGLPEPLSEPRSRPRPLRAEEGGESRQPARSRPT